ncbi:MAG TPA: hypothetical protein VMG08_19345 [Allosphingosinicella sp.]|nr:hypothetical protein [Allosphingosinicella sp.]
MSQFEFFMTFYSLLLGLAVAELLLGFANLLRNRARPKLGLLTPLLGMFVFLQLMATFIDAWSRLQGVSISMEELALPTGIGVLLFFVSVIVVPRDPTEWTDLDEYFRANRRWAIGLVIAANLLVLGYEVPHLPSVHVPVYVAINALGFLLMGGAMLLRQRLAIAACLGGLILFFLYIYSDFSLALFVPAT